MEEITEIEIAKKIRPIVEQKAIEDTIEEDIKKFKSKLDYLEKTEPQKLMKRTTEFSISAPAGRGKRRVITSKIEIVSGKRKRTTKSIDIYRKNLKNQDYLKIVLQENNGIVEPYIATKESYVRMSKDDCQDLCAVAYALLYYQGRCKKDVQLRPNWSCSKYENFVAKLQMYKNKICEFTRRVKK